jgi:hypothetical protein
MVHPLHIISIVLRYWPFGGRQFSPEIERIISRRRIAVWIAVAAMAAIAIAGGSGPGYFYALMLMLWAVASGFATAQTIRLRRRDVTTWWLLDAWFRPIRPELAASRGSRDESGRWALRWMFPIAVVGYFVYTLFAQVDAVAYLTGQLSPGVFIPQSHSVQCAPKNPTSCSATTAGILQGTGGNAGRLSWLARAWPAHRGPPAPHALAVWTAIAHRQLCRLAHPRRDAHRRWAGERRVQRRPSLARP